MTTTVGYVDIIARLAVSIIVSGMIGYDREHKNRPAGIKTHILVCVGACIIAMIQREIGFQAIVAAQQYPKFSGVIRADEARLIAQVVSGVGFLGAGTIIVTHHSIRGLTTAASLWATAGLGIAVGMGYYKIALISAVSVILVLTLISRIIRVNSFKKIEIKYQHKEETKEFIQEYFEKKAIKITDVNFSASKSEYDSVIYKNIYTIELPKKVSYAEIIEDISMNKNILMIQTISV
ncbi:MgtC/SapB family protein [Pediococcus ethanolidurans]|uniref:Mg2+ transporter-C (MgtC) family protein n=2 Tax=Pediococcus ethanolidurans TaxID=319653 RepID=A0A1H9KT65_9LACO|nr:MgtC/SapB family protein [Pediococcus ethanolidurans]GEN94023.1 magnesium transporter MgtC [Pediococcus ethanolidurans]SER02229.1 putative Mg2+ transporter-C (MgtC) family protein [Pediococcus ethanolidurans]